MGVFRFNLDLGTGDTSHFDAGRRSSGRDRPAVGSGNYAVRDHRPPEYFLWKKYFVDNYDMFMFQECRDGLCSDPCEGFNECGTNAVCVAVNHLPTCKCPEGYKVSIFMMGRYVMIGTKRLQYFFISYF